MSEKEPASCSRDEQRVMELAMEMGQILLQSGAEIFRVEDTMRRVCGYFHVNNCSFYVTGNGMMSSINGAERSFANVRYTPVKGAQLNRVVAINQLSREIAEGKYENVEDVERRVEEIKALPAVPYWLACFASALAAGSFCVLFGGGVADTVTAFAAGFLLHVFLLSLGSRVSKILANIGGGVLISLLCLVSYRLGIGQNLGHMLSGAILPLVPGVAFTNGIRDIGSGDYLSGTVRLLDAFWTFLCIAIGVGIVFGVYHGITGGVLL